MAHKLTDIGKIESFPTKQKIGNWFMRDITYGPRTAKRGQRDLFYKGQLCMSAVIEHLLAMEFDFYGVIYKEVTDSVNTILSSFGVDIKVDRDNIRYGPKWKDIASSMDLVILRRVP